VNTGNKPAIFGITLLITIYYPQQDDASRLVIMEEYQGAIHTTNVETFGLDVGNAFNQAMQIHAIPYGSQTYSYARSVNTISVSMNNFFTLESGIMYIRIDSPMG
jgi:hypothetical protein